VINRYDVLGVQVSATDYARAADAICAAATERRPMAVAALASHGIMEAHRDPALRAQLNTFELVLPDGQSVRWGMNFLGGAGLREPVSGPDLTELLLARAATEGLPVYFYGSTPTTLARLTASACQRHPGLVIAGVEPSRFAVLDSTELPQIARRIADTGARLVFVGLGCPRQEAFTHALRPHVDVPVIAVGAAFDFSAGLLSRPPKVWRRLGLEWLWRLALEPGRLWRRYLLLGPHYLGLLAGQRLRVWQPAPLEPAQPAARVPA
jgi:N-acetylglucosaminyldiphosphoundecaprenol N-acetyl-beta-D-mannosaminyltransferase